MYRIIQVMVAVGAVAVVGGALFVDLHPQAQEPVEEESQDVTESELELFVDVYCAMQSDHDLTIDAVLAQRGTSLEEFRNIERRIQRQRRLVKRVREALLDHAKAQAGSFSNPTAQARRDKVADP